MKKAVIFLGITMLFFSCKDKAVKEPDHLIEKETMQNIIYDLALLDAIKYNEPNTTENYRVNPKEFIYKKYKIDSVQFAQNNVYYASNFEEYKSMYDNVVKRIDGKKAVLDSLLKKERKKDSLVEVKKKRIEAKKIAKRVKDSLQKIKKKDSLLLLKKKIKKGKNNSITINSAIIKSGAKVN
ncbi:MAG: DUF4296 domain-containing protein [Bacteroidota bacterium]